MKVASAEQMRQIDKSALEQYGIPGLILMENAGRELFEICLHYLEESGGKRVTVVAGKGNNGGDGFVTARLLKNLEYDINVVFVGDIWGVRGDALTNLEILKKIGVAFLFENDEVEQAIAGADLIIDAIFGTGVRGEIVEPYRSIIEKINQSGAYIVSADIPSGIHADTGKVEGIAIRADETVTFGLPKKGLLLHPGIYYSGKLQVADISIPKKLVEETEISLHVLTREEALALLPKRRLRSNKGTYGKLFVAAGCKTMVGAAAFACKAAYRAGAGLIYCCCVESIVPIMQTLVPEAVAIALWEDHGAVSGRSFSSLTDEISKASAVVLGPGLGDSFGVKDFVMKMITACDVPLLIDADGLNAISSEPAVLRDALHPPLITPHPGEMARLCGKGIHEVLEDTLATALDFAKEYNCIVLLKDAKTIIAAPDGRAYINPTGCSALAKGGSGDILSGIAGAFLAQGMGVFEAATLAAYVHGLMGEKMEEALTAYGGLAGEMADYIPQAIKILKQN